jgi:hypothetical protein
MLTLGDYGAAGWWVEGDAAVVDQVAEAWARALGSSVRLYAVAVDPDRQVALRGWTVGPDGRRPLSAVTDDEPADEELSAEDIAAERLSIALEMFEQLHHEDAYRMSWPHGAAA